MPPRARSIPPVRHLTVSTRSGTRVPFEWYRRTTSGERIVAWALLVTAGLFETAFAVSLKQSENFTRLWWSVAFVVCAAASFVLLSSALRTLPVGTAYAVWTGIGAGGTAVVGMAVLGDPVTTMRIVAILLILGGVLMLQLAPSAAH